MNKPNITWLVLEEYGEDESLYIPKKIHEQEDVISSGETLTLNIQVWNNKGGKETIDDIVNPKLIIYFDNYEDSIFLNLFKISINNKGFEELQLLNGKGYIDMPTLYGYANNGSDINVDNYCNIQIELGPIPYNIKSDIKNFILDIES